MTEEANGSGLGHVVVVEDDDYQRDLIVRYLTRQGFRVSEAANGATLRQLLEGGRRGPAIDVVLLDVHLPGEDGFSLARHLRERGKLGVIMVTSADDEVDRVVGLEAGADDYVVKPFSPRELLARIKSLMRRMGDVRPAVAGARLRFGRCLLDLDTRRLSTPEGEDVALTATEFEMLKAFAENPNRVLTRERLLELSSQRELDAFDRSIDIRVTRLRRKVEHDPEKPQAIRTLRGAGYMFVPD